MNQNMKIVGLITMLLIIGLPIVNALTGYGIKGNKNLNPDVLADGSSSGSSSTGTSSGLSDKKPDIKLGLGQYGQTYQDGKKTCRTYSRSQTTTCDPGSTICNPGTWTVEGTECWEPAN